MTIETGEVLDETSADRRAPILDLFSEKLLDTLYELNLMPYSLGESPATYEKYPQELISLVEIKRTDGRAGLQQAFDEWQANMLRKSKHKQTRQDATLKIGAFRAWALNNNNANALLDKGSIRHLRKSMFGRTYAYLYPRLRLIMEYRDYCRDNNLLGETYPVYNTVGREKSLLRAVADEQFIADHLPLGSKVAQGNIADALGPESVGLWLRKAQEFLLQNVFYFESAFRRRGRDDGAETEDTNDITPHEEGIEA